jgi:hypothetical protein
MSANTRHDTKEKHNFKLDEEIFIKTITQQVTRSFTTTYPKHRKDVADHICHFCNCICKAAPQPNHQRRQMLVGFVPEVQFHL